MIRTLTHGIILSLLIPLLSYGASPDTLDVAVQARQEASLKVCVAFIGKTSARLEEVAAVVKDDLEFEGHFSLDYLFLDEIPTVSEMKIIGQKGYLIALFLQERTKKKAYSIDWHLYDMSDFDESGKQPNMISAKRYTPMSGIEHGWGHELADTLFYELTGTPSSFATRIAYCKNVAIPGKRAVRHICVADFNGKNMHAVVKRPTLNIAPRWNRDSKRPLLFYSESTGRNFRLMVNDLHGHSWVASNLDGLNMLPTFSADGKQVIYCASRGTGSCQLYRYKKGSLECLTNNEGHNISPTMSADGSRVYFCSDYKGNKPAIYCYYTCDGRIERITNGGAAYSPNYCDATQQLVYSQQINGILQLFVYNEQRGTHTQVTFDEGNKEECSWSPCGTYILYGVSSGVKERVALLNNKTKKQIFLTAKEDDCSYPTWSPRYDRYLALS